MNDIILQKDYLPILQKDYSLLPHNTFGIPARARYFAEYGSVEELRARLRDYHALTGSPADNRSADFLPPPVLHIGSGSNLLFLRDYSGLVLHSRISGIELLEEREAAVRIRVGAGMSWDELVEETLRRGWYGLENLSYIPGEVGAAAVQNIGAYGAEAKDFVLTVHLLDMVSLNELCLSAREMEYAYRYSVLKSAAMRGRYAVTHVDFLLSRRFEPRLEYGGLRAALANEAGVLLTAERLRQVIIGMRQSKLPDPKELGNAGSFFMNPVVERAQFERLQEQYPEMPRYEVDPEHVKIPAGWLIEKAGWKGRTLGRAGVYERQALVLVNLGGATGQDVLRLCEAVQADVLRQFGIAIRPEVNFIKE